MHFQWDTDANTSQNDSNAEASSDATPATSTAAMTNGDRLGMHMNFM